MNDQKQMENFVGLSVVLTGFSQRIIAPNIDPINIKVDYLAKFQQEIDNSDDILSKYANLKAQGLSNEQIGTQIRELYDMPCKQLIFLWYSGAWAELVQTEQNGKTNTMVASTLLSSKSYTQGLAWQVMQAHPMGDSNYVYGYWNETPAPLSGYTGNKND